MKNNTEKLEETKLTISLRTGVMHRNKQEKAHTQNDYTSYYIGAINYFIRIALEAESLLELQTDSKAFLNDARFRENLQLLVQISEGLAEWLPDYSSAMRECADVKEADGENEQVSDAPEHHPDLDALALQISEVLKNPNLPVELYNAILHGADDIINEPSSDVSERFETSPEHIKAVLKMRSSE
jgi:glycosyltransferase involved in cell wall biosynthesis